MNVKRWLVFGLTVAVAVAAWKITETKAPQTEVTRQLFLQGLLDQINTIDHVTLRSIEHTTELRREGEQWQLANRDGFPVLPGSVRKALLQLGGLRKVEAKTESPERYARLGVESLDSDNASGTHVRAGGGEQPALINLIVGRQRDGAANVQHYVRAADNAQSWLVEGALELPTDPIRWIDAQIADIDSERVRSVRIATPGETDIHIVKTEPADNFFRLMNVPEGYEAKSRAIVSSLGAVLLDLRFNDVRARQRVASLNPQRQLVVETFDGLRATMDEFDIDGSPYMQARFEYDPSLIVTSSDAQTSSDDPGATPESDTPEVDVHSEVDILTTLTRDWVYLLPDYKRRMIERGFESLIKTPDKTTEDDKN